VFDILHRVGIKASLDKVYNALGTPEGVAGWWTTATTGDNKAGGMITFRFTDNGRELGFFDMKIVELKQEDDFTIVLFSHEGWKEPVEFMYHCSTKWAIFLMSLKSLGETGKGQPSPNDVKIGNWH